MKILMLILASSGEEYAGFETLWRRYMHTHPDIDAYFYKANPKLETDTMLDGDTVWVKCSDGLDGVYEKLMRTFRYFRPQLNSYDLVFRTNLSSFIDFNEFVPYCESLPKTNCYAGVHAIHYEMDIHFASGAGFAISIDLVKRLLDENPPEVFLDDVTLGKAITSWGIPIKQANRISVFQYGILRYEHFPEPNEFLFHYRAKTENRQVDVQELTNVAQRRGAFVSKIK